ncbi:MAG: ANTAR domain-containing protein [Lachnospiraceae bacterium]|nr:ANTAR domain-containing protein [Lachnospiraceae bacterium]
MNEERIYSVLIVSASRSFIELMLSNLPEAGYSPIHTVPSISSARRKTMDKSYDFVIINAPLPDDVGTRFAIDASANSVVLLIADSELYASVNSIASENGVFTLQKPFSKVMITTALRWMASAREIVRRTQKKNLSIDEKMEEIRIVNRAKWILINELSMSEPEAHRYIEKQAMDRCISKGQIAKEIINTYS